MLKFNLKYLLLFMLFLAVEIIIAIFIHDTIIRPYIGDILVVVLIYCFCHSFLNINNKLLAFYVFVFAVLVETMQMINIVSILGLEANSIASIIIGSTFDLKDIGCYFMGALLLIGWESICKTYIQIISLFVFGLITTITFMLLAYNGLWWPIDPTLMGYEVKGVDVARYQGDIAWEILAEQGVSFAFAKATEGSSYEDPCFDNNVIGAIDANIKIGAYHFFSTETAGINQAKHFLDVVSEHKLSMPLVLDFEVVRTDNNSEKQRIITEAKSFLLKIEQDTTKKPIIYTTYESYYAYLKDDFRSYDFWIRDLIKKPNIPNERIVIWQYCNRGRLKGIDEKQKYIDLNVLFQ